MEEKLRALIKYAMLAKRADASTENISRANTFKSILDEAQKIAKEKRTDKVSDSMIIDAAKREIKKQNDLLQYCSDRPEKVAEISFAINAAKELLPEMPTEEEIKTFVIDNKNTYNNIGLMMKALKEKFGAGLDGKIASQIIKQIL